MKKPKGLSEKAARKLFASIKQRSATRDFLVQQWVETFGRAVRKLVRDPKAEWPWSVLFWVRLYGVVGELDDVFRKTHALYEEAGHRPANGTLGWYSDRVFAAIQRIRGEFSEDELLFVQYFRHRSAHVFQDAYYLQGNMNQSDLQETLHVPIVGKEFDRGDLMSRVRQIGKRYQNDSGAAAVVFAKRIRIAVVDLEMAVAALHKYDRATSKALGERIDAAVDEALSRRFRGKEKREEPTK